MEANAHTARRPLADPADDRKRLRRRGGRRLAARPPVDDPQCRRQRLHPGRSAQSTRFVGGTQQFSSGSPPSSARRVVLGAPVRAIPTIAVGRWSSRATVDDGGRAGPWSRCRRRSSIGIEFQPPLLPSHSQLAQRQPMGTAIKCNAVYQRPFWRPRGLTRLRDLRHGPGEDRLRQLAARRQPRRPGRILRGKRRQRLL